MSDSHPLLLVDGSSYLYRAHFAPGIGELTTKDGRPTGAIRGVVGMLRRLKKDYPESHMAVVFDAKGKTFRDDLYADYKANREAMPSELSEQVEPLFKIIKAMGLPLIVIDRVEADDVIGTLALRSSNEGRKVIVSTGDKDMAQLVNQHVTLVNTMTNTTMDSEGVKEKFGLPPELIIDYLALMGDKIDNIPGIPGVGPKTAQALLNELGPLNTVYERLDEVAELKIRGAKKLAEKLSEHEKNARLSYELATIKTDVELDVSFDDLDQQPQDNDALVELFTEYEFKSWLDNMDGFAKDVAGDTQARFQSKSLLAQDKVKEEYETILDQKRFDEWIEQLASCGRFAFDTETNSLDYVSAEVVGVSFCIEVGKAAYVPFIHSYLGAPDQLDRSACLAALKPILESTSVLKIGQHIKFDRNVLRKYDIDLQGIEADTMLESYVYNSTSNRHDMDTLAKTYLGRSTVKFEDIAGKGAKQMTFDQIDLEQAGPYACEDADITLRLHQVLHEHLVKEPSLQNVFTRFEMPLIEVLSDMESTGTYIDADLLQKQSTEIAEKLLAIQTQVFELAGTEFNLGSPKQLGEVLFDKLEIPVVKKTASGAPSTAEEVMQKLAEDYELPAMILEYRSLSKLKGTYTDKLPRMISPVTGRVHTSYHQAVTATGRLSSSDPNLQNIPIRTAEGRRVRQAFIAPPGYRVLAADYSQIELRLMAQISGDKSLIHAFANDLDVHTATASEVFDTPLDEVTKDQRRNAKTINFGLIYGMSAFGLAKALGTSRDDAQRYIDLYFDRYPGVADFMKETKEKARKQKFVETLYGRRLYLPDIDSRNQGRRTGAERLAINAPMQGTAADIMKLAMIHTHQWLKKESPPVKMVMQVHDELVFEVEDSFVDDAKQKICDLMANAVSLDVPLVVEADVGDNWDEAH